MSKIFLSFLTMVLVLVVSACGNSGPSTKLSFTVTDFAFSPEEFVVPMGEEVTLHITDNGTMEHSLVIMKYATDAGEMFDEADQDNVFWEIDLQPGDSETAVFIAPKQPGTYQIICGMPGHLQSGMIGKLIVTE